MRMPLSGCNAHKTDLTAVSAIVPSSPFRHAARAWNTGVSATASVTSLLRPVSMPPVDHHDLTGHVIARP